MTGMRLIGGYGMARSRLVEFGGERGCTVFLLRVSHATAPDKIFKSEGDSLEEGRQDGTPLAGINKMI